MSTLYRKQGRRYYPVAEFDTFDAWPQGAHLVVCKPGSTVTRFNIDPDDAAIMAAAEKRRALIRDCVTKHMELRPAKRQLTPKQVEAWHRFQKAMDGNIYSVEHTSVRELADAVAELLINGAKEDARNEDPKF